MAAWPAAVALLEAEAAMLNWPLALKMPAQTSIQLRPVTAVVVQKGNFRRRRRHRHLSRHLTQYVYLMFKWQFSVHTRTSTVIHLK